MSPKDIFAPEDNNEQKMDQAKPMRLQNSHKAAIVILLLSVAWMASGLLKGDEEQAAVTATAGGETASVSKASVKPVRVRVSTLNSEEHVRKITVLGRIEADVSVDVRAELAGRVAEVVAQKGNGVAVGDVLVKLDPENLPALLSEAKARLRQREIAYESARKLSKGGYSSQLNVAQAKADMEAARAQVSGMQRDLDNATITAPIAGIVNDLPLEAGDYIDKAGAIVAHLIDLNTMIAVCAVTEHDIDAIDLGGNAMVRLPGGRELAGVVSFISKSSNMQTRTFRVEVSLPTPDQSVPEGVTAELRLPTERVVAHNITPALLTLDDSGALGVKTVDANNRVVFYAVEMIADTKDGIWLTGLPDTVRVISVGQEFVTPGQVVEPVEGALPSAVILGDAKVGEGN